MFESIALVFIKQIVEWLQENLPSFVSYNDIKLFWRVNPNSLKSFQHKLKWFWIFKNLVLCSVKLHKIFKFWDVLAKANKTYTFLSKVIDKSKPKTLNRKFKYICLWKIIFCYKIFKFWDVLAKANKTYTFLSKVIDKSKPKTLNRKFKYICLWKIIFCFYMFSNS